MDQPTLLTLVAALLEHRLDSWLVPPGVPPASLGVRVDGVEDSAPERGSRKNERGLRVPAPGAPGLRLTPPAPHTQNPTGL